MVHRVIQRLVNNFPVSNLHLPGHFLPVLHFGDGVLHPMFIISVLEVIPGVRSPRLLPVFGTVDGL